MTTVTISMIHIVRNAGQKLMTNYVVYGSKEIKYYIDVEADDLISAVQAAGKAESHLWMPLEDDDIIEPYDVIESESIVDLSTNL